MRAASVRPHLKSSPAITTMRLQLSAVGEGVIGVDLVVVPACADFAETMIRRARAVVV